LRWPRKLLLVGAGVFFLLAGLASWYGWHSVQRQLLLFRMKNHYDIGQRELRRHHYRRAGAYFNLALKAWHEAEARPGFLPVANGGFDGFLTAGNCYLMQRQLRLARRCYEQALKHDPYSVNVLTALGNCLYRLGEYDLALRYLARSHRICPLKKELRPILEKLRRWSAAGKQDGGRQ